MDKADRVRSYVQAQLPFVPFYRMDLLGPSDYHPEASALEPALLSARNPLRAVQSVFNQPSEAGACTEIQGSKGGLAEADVTPRKGPAENRKTGRAKCLPTAEEQNQRPPTLETGTQIVLDPDASGGSTKILFPARREKRNRRGKSILPTGLSFLYGAVPKNVGPQRLTVGRSMAS
jgi:hypothetical protein